VNGKAEDYVPKIARNEMFYFIARASTLAATLIGLPLAGFMLSRVVSQADALQLSVTQQNVEIRVLSATLKSQLDNDVKQLTDHELRLRALERGH
jgi:hypothetical protein